MNTIPDYPEFDYNLLMDSLKKYAYPRDRTTRLLRSGSIIRIKKGLYAGNDSRNPFSREVLANLVYGPSYLSLEFALQFHGLIPEAVTVLTSVTTQRNRSYDTPVGRFEYVHLPKRFYAAGFDWQPLASGRGFLMAGPEKALFDTLYVRTPNVRKADIETHLFENLRLDRDDFKRLDFSGIDALLNSCSRPSIRALAGFLRGGGRHG
jgi:hypothetical protein